VNPPPPNSFRMLHIIKSASALPFPPFPSPSYLVLTSTPCPLRRLVHLRGQLPVTSSCLLSPPNLQTRSGASPCSTRGPRRGSSRAPPPSVDDAPGGRQAACALPCSRERPPLIMRRADERAAAPASSMAVSPRLEGGRARKGNLRGRHIHGRLHPLLSPTYSAFTALCHRQSLPAV
jgi:hypothetical protein